MINPTVLRHRKAAGNWESGEDRILRKCVKEKLSPMEAAYRLNRLEHSVVIRAKVIGCPFVDAG